MTPDICTLGKIIGGEFPLAALGASTEIMAHFDKARVGADYRSAKHSNSVDNTLWNEALRREGVFQSAGKLYPSLALSEANMEQTGRAFEIAAGAVAKHQTEAT